MSFFIYILYSSISDIYYVGYTENVERRLSQHNNPVKTTFTAKHKPWELKCFFEISSSRSEAMRAEKYIKKQKSKLFIKKIIVSPEEQNKIAQSRRDAFGIS